MDGIYSRCHLKDHAPGRPLQIRILELLPRLDDGPISCRLTLGSLGHDVQDTSDYEALSYTWGASAGRRTITLNDVAGVVVTDNLASALARFRLQDQTRRLWVDALCINQSDNEERASQVSRMGAIYKAASRVLVWLGESSDTGDRDLDVASTSQDSSTEVIRKQQNRALHRLHSKGPPFWWQRTWVVQEFVLPTLAPVASFDRWTLEWADFTALVSNTEMYSVLTWYQDVVAPVLNLNTIREATHRSSEASYDLLSLALQTCSTDATQPMDKVYGLLGLVDTAEAARIVPDYDQATWQTFALATFVSVIAASTLDSLKLVTFPIKSTGKGFPDRELFDLPSWTVNFCFKSGRPGGDVSEIGKFLHFVQPTWTTILRERKAVASLSSDCKLLTVRGYKFDRVKRVAGLPAEYERRSVEDAVRSIFDALQELPTINPYRMLGKALPGKWKCSRHTWNQRKDCLCERANIDWSGLGSQVELRRETMFNPQARTWDTGFLLGNVFHRWSTCVCTSKRTDSGPLPASNPLTTYRAFADVVVRGHHDYAELAAGCLDFFATERGFLRSAPRGVAPGDTVALLFGSSCPAVLRQYDHGALSFHGLAYVHGIMTNELVTLCHPPGLAESDFVLR